MVIEMVWYARIHIPHLVRLRGAHFHLIGFVLLCSAISADTQSQLSLIRPWPNQHVSSSTHFPSGPSCHNTNIRWFCFAGFRLHLDSPICGQFATYVGTLVVPLILLMSSDITSCWPTSSSTTTGPICFRVEHLVVNVHAHRHTRHHLQLEVGWRFLPRADRRLEL